MANSDQFSDGLQGQERQRKVTPLGVAFGTDLNSSFGTNGKANIAESWDSRPFKFLPPKTRQSDVIKFGRKVNIFSDFVI